MSDKNKSIIKRYLNYLNPDPEKFDKDALKGRQKYKDDYRILAESLSSNINFENFFDVGCAQGLLMMPLHKKGFDVRGIEVSEDVTEFLPDSLKPHVTIGDFQEVAGSYDLVCCVEVAEHIEPARSKALVSKLCDLSDQHIYFTAAPPGQHGHGHINCRPHEHWIRWFNAKGWHVDELTTQKIREDLATVEHTHWLKENSFVLSLH
ncbi:class I SAM-dependent methyltransferase [Salinibacter grassmerensis]|uniref:class I SAM-dependent methyltransferase n=1 Tax=Salinibacter grassmerensis TaxID=3040353 RepID=UPI0021E73270|nr:methyltransferase domain-containing protein [Salinibacter grassmerensis]